MIIGSMRARISELHPKNSDEENISSRAGGVEVMIKSTALAIIGMTTVTMPTAAEDVRKAIEQVNSRFVESFKSGDAATIASLYTDTAKILPPDATEIAGQEAIQSLWQSWIDDGFKNLTLESTEVGTSGNLAYEVGLFSLQVPAENNAMVTATGNYVVVWKRDAGGNWRLHIDTWNDAPAR
jgi:ketosteroid isomerase-like protein